VVFGKYLSVQVFDICMSEIDGALVELDLLGVKILEALEEHGGEATSTDLRNYLGVEKRAKFNYRVREYLAPEGLIEATQPDPEPGNIPPQELRLTERGEQYLSEVDSEGLVPEGIVERLDRLEEQVDGLRSENKKLREENEELKAAIEGSDVEQIVGRVQELTNDVDRLQTKTGNLQDALGDLNSDPVVGSDFAPTAINTGYLLGNVARELLVEQVGEDRVEEVFDEKRAKLESEDKVLEKSE
jgi:vacuolar-type H+-ATPase subunit I/STV1